MISGYDIIVFSDQWGRHPFSCQHILKFFLPENRLIWVTPTGMRNPKLSLYDAKRACEKMKTFLSSDSRIEESAPDDRCPSHVIPFALPFNNIVSVRMFNNRVVVTKVKKILSQNTKRIVITTLPITAEYVDCFDADIIVYYIVDDFMEWPGINKSYISYMEKKLLTKADVLIGSAERLCLIKKGKTETIFIPHGVDYEHFAVSKNPEPPESLAIIKRPIIGFFGAISPWIDLDLIDAAASRRPEWSFVFIGPVDADIRTLKDLRNVHFLGKIDYDELPHYAKHFDVGIIPFVVNDLTESVNPLKLLEYFACGLPVVSTNLPEVSVYREHVHIAHSTEEFIKGLDEAVLDTPSGSDQRQGIARGNSWQSVAGRFSAAIECALDKP